MDLAFHTHTMNSMPAKKPVLVILHRLESEPGSIGQYFRANGIPLDIRRPRFGDALPSSMDGHAGAVVFGGPMSANDPDCYIKKEIDWIGVPLTEKKPFLGICLGAQLLAKHLGGEVREHRLGCFEAGYAPIQPREEAHALGPWPSHVYHWHREEFTLSRDAVHLAEGEVFQNQAFRYGPSAFGVQFHPEITLAIIHRWIVRGGARLSLPCAQPPADHIKDHIVHGAKLRAWTFRFLEKWLHGGLELEERREAEPLQCAA